MFSKCFGVGFALRKAGVASLVAVTSNEHQGHDIKHWGSWCMHPMTFLAIKNKGNAQTALYVINVLLVKFATFYVLQSCFMRQE